MTSNLVPLNQMVYDTIYAILKDKKPELTEEEKVAIALKYSNILIGL